MLHEADEGRGKRVKNANPCRRAGHAGGRAGRGRQGEDGCRQATAGNQQRRRKGGQRVIDRRSHTDHGKSNRPSRRSEHKRRISPYWISSSSSPKRLRE